MRHLWRFFTGSSRVLQWKIPWFGICIISRTAHNLNKCPGSPCVEMKWPTPKYAKSLEIPAWLILVFLISLCQMSIQNCMFLSCFLAMCKTVLAKMYPGRKNMTALQIDKHAFTWFNLELLLQSCLFHEKIWINFVMQNWRRFAS